MKITNVSQSRIYLHDLRLNKQSQTEGRRGEDQYLAPGQSVYLPNTSEVMRSVLKGDIKGYIDRGLVEIEDTAELEAFGGDDTVVLTHNFGIPPQVQVVKQVGATWVDATGSYDAVHNSTFTTVTITNTTVSAQTFFIRLLA